MGLVIVVGVCGFVSLVLLILRHQIGEIFTSDSEVIAVVAGALWLLPLDYFFSCIFIAAAMVLEGLLFLYKMMKKQCIIVNFLVDFNRQEWVEQRPQPLLQPSQHG